MDLGAFLKLSYSCGQGNLAMKDVDMSGKARELCVAISVTAGIIFCSLSPLIFKEVLGGPFIVLTSQEK